MWLWHAGGLSKHDGWVQEVIFAKRFTLPSIAAFASSLAVAATTASAPPPGTTIEEVIVASTPLGDLELSADRVPGNVQQTTGKDIERVRSAGLAQFLNQKSGSIVINEAQANPLQPDVQFRGFVASPLLGQPQGIAVYQNGVRINDPFGDIVNWALVPEGAIASIDLIPGSNPVFGLNTLGGALSIRTKNGFTDTGTRGEVLGGSFGRVIARAESGANFNDRLSYYGSARYLTDAGWRQFSPSEAVHLFGDAGWRSDSSSLNMNVTWVETDLTGNGPAPVQLIDRQRDAVYTSPDRTQNSLAFVTLTGGHSFAQRTQLKGAIYFRRSDIDSLNGDESNFGECETAPGFVCEEDSDDSFALDPRGNPIAFNAAVDGATLNRSTTKQDTYGASAQLSITHSLAGRENRLIVGGSADRSTVQFRSSTELGSFNDQREAIRSGLLVDASFVSLNARTENAGLFFTDTFSLTPDLGLTLAGRYNDSRVVLRDRIGTALDGDHDFRRFNGATGITWRMTPGLRLYANYSESNRAPSPVELTCADADAPCALPNSFLSDPPLQQVIANTLEAGARGLIRNTRWHLGLFRTTNRNDILFISAGELTNRGFFDNIGDTRRQGIEMNLSGLLLRDRLDWFVNYTRLDAQFREDFTVSSPHNPAAIDGEIAVRRGARIPGIPEQLLKVGANMQLTSQLAVGVDVLYESDQFLRGDEANLTAPLNGYTVVNASAEWKLNTNLTLFAQADNLFNADYASFGLFGAASEVLGEKYDDPRFVSPGAPIGGWIGFKWTL